MGDWNSTVRNDSGSTCISFRLKLICEVTFFQVIKHLTGGGADYSFECIGDTGMVTTALQACCDVSFLYVMVSFSFSSISHYFLCIN